MTRIANEAAELLGIDTRLQPDQLEITEDYVGTGYGAVTPECLEAIALLARTEGILLDPAYTGKSMAGLIDHVSRDRFKREQNVVFVHTGGTPALFAYNEELINGIPQRNL